MKKKLVILFVIIPFIIFGVVAYKAPYLLPSEMLEPIRSLRDFGQELGRTTERNIGIPIDAKTTDPNFVVEEYVTGLRTPTTMTFINNEILILEKNTGVVALIKNGIIQKSPVLDVAVSFGNEQGLLGIVGKDSQVFLYFTESDKDGGQPIGNHIYKYDWDGNRLINPTLLKKLPSFSPWHNGGAMTIDNDNNIFAVIGDQTTTASPKENYRILQNTPLGKFDDTSIILNVESDPLNPSASDNPTSYYHAIGIRNSFGLAVDPITGHLWDTENGPEHFDEVNLVLPGFNSGWREIMGPATSEQLQNLPNLEGFQYSDPKFSWERTVVPTALTFVQSKSFTDYHDFLLVGDCLGNIYKFKLNSTRTGFVFNDPNLKDSVANLVKDGEGKESVESLNELIFGSGFGCITDLEFGPDGNLYVVSLSKNTIFKIKNQ